jgi:hypothetical protein
MVQDTEIRAHKKTPIHWLAGTTLAVVKKKAEGSADALMQLVRFNKLIYNNLKKVRTFQLIFELRNTLHYIIGIPAA